MASFTRFAALASAVGVLAVDSIRRVGRSQSSQHSLHGRCCRNSSAFACLSCREEMADACSEDVAYCIGVCGGTWCPLSRAASAPPPPVPNCGPEPPCQRPGASPCPGHCMPCAGDNLNMWNATCTADGIWSCRTEYGSPGWRVGMADLDCPSDTCLGYPRPNMRCVDRRWVCNEGCHDDPDQVGCLCEDTAPAPPMQ